MDEHVPRAVTMGLRRRGIDVLTAQEDRMDRQPDSAVLSRATELGRVLFTQDDDLLREARLRQERGGSFLGVIYAHQMHVTIGQLVKDLELIGTVAETTEFHDRVEFLPLK
jgi:hypothetical protein